MYPSPFDEVITARRLAEHIMALDGPDLRYMSDAELLAQMKEIAKVMLYVFPKLGVSAAEAEKAFRLLSEAFRVKHKPDV